MNEFVKDYVDLCKDSGRFYKKHWKGVVLLNAVIIGAEYAWYKYNDKRFRTILRRVLRRRKLSNGLLLFFSVISRHLHVLL